MPINSKSRLENCLMAGAATTGVISGSAIASASALQPDIAPGSFDHILQKDTPLDQMIIFGQHNAGALAGTGTLPLVATNQTMTIEKTLEITPVRGLDLDIHLLNGELVINHGGYFDPTVNDDNVPTLDETVETINHWLNKPQNQNEVLFLKFGESNLTQQKWEELYGSGNIMYSNEYNELFNTFGRSPTINEIRANGYQIAVYDNSGAYFESGKGETGWSKMLLPDESDLHHLDIARYIDTGDFDFEGLGKTIRTSHLDDSVIQRYINNIDIGHHLEHINLSYNEALPNDLLFLDFADHDIPNELIYNAFGKYSVLDLTEYHDLCNRYDRDLTITEIRSEGYRVSLFELEPPAKVGGLSYPTVWEDRTLLEHLKGTDLKFGELTTNDIAGQLTTGDIDRLFQSGEGAYISLDQISPNDPRFFTPEARSSLSLRPDLKLMGILYESDPAFQTTLLGFSTTSASGTAAFALAGGAYQGFLNEKKIRHQDKLLPGHLKTMELSCVLLRRKRSKNKKSLDDEVTQEELIKLYKANQLKAMTKDTAMAGANATVSLTGSVLALAFIFPPLFPVFAGTSATITGTGIIATSLATVGNRRRLNKAIDQAVEQPRVREALEQRVTAMNQQTDQARTTAENIDEFLANMVADRESAERLRNTGTGLLATSLVTRPAV